MFHRLHSFFFQNTSTKQTIIKNSLWLLLAEFINKGSVFLITLFIANRLGPEQFGVMSFVTAFIGIFIMFTDFGFTTLMVREVSKDQSKLKDYLVNLSLLKVLLGFGTFLLIGIICVLVEKFQPYIILLLLYTGYAVVNNFSEFIRAFYRPNENMQHEAFLKSMSGIIFLIILSAILTVTNSIQTIFYGFLLSSIISLLVSILYVLNSFSIKHTQISTSLCRHLLQKGFYIGMGGFFIALYISSDQVIMGMYNQFENLGVYSLAYRFTLMLGIVSGIIFTTVLPKVSTNEYAEDFVKHYKMGRVLIIKYNFLLIFVIEVILGVLSFFDFGDYQKVIHILQFLVLYNLIEPLGYWGYVNLISIKKEQTNLYIVIFVGLLNVIGNLIFIPIFSYYGAIGTTLISYLVYFILVNHVIIGKFQLKK